MIITQHPRSRVARPVSLTLVRARPATIVTLTIGPRKIGPSTPLIPRAGLEVNAGESKRGRLTTKKVFEKPQQEAG